jgi:TPP-dependent pyruvate/acetoin dehydrogenase alpha subunit
LVPVVWSKAKTATILLDSRRSSGAALEARVRGSMVLEVDSLRGAPHGRGDRPARYRSQAKKVFCFRLTESAAVLNFYLSQIQEC